MGGHPWLEVAEGVGVEDHPLQVGKWVGVGGHPWREVGEGVGVGVGGHLVQVHVERDLFVSEAVEEVGVGHPLLYRAMNGVGVGDHREAQELL